MSRLPPLWLQAGDYAASTDRRLIGALYPAARCDGCQVGIAGTGDMNVAVQPGCVAVPTANGTGTALCYSDGVELVTLDSAPAAGLDRIDMVVCQLSGADVGGGADEFIFTKITGVPAQPPTAPALPAGSVCLAQITVIGGSVAVDPARIFDTRPSTLAVPVRTPPTVDELPWTMPRGWVAGYDMLPAAEITGTGFISMPALVVPVKAGRRYRCSFAGRGSTGAAGGASIRVNGTTAPGGPWTNYQMAVERTNAAGEPLSGSVVTYYKATTDNPNFQFQCGWYGGGTLKILANSCSALAEDIGGF